MRSGRVPPRTPVLVNDPAPIPTLAAPLSHATDALLVGAARIDRAGRVHERILLRALGWAPGHRLDLGTVHGMVVVASAPAGTSSTAVARSCCRPQPAGCVASSLARRWCSRPQCASRYSSSTRQRRWHTS